MTVATERGDDTSAESGEVDRGKSPPRGAHFRYPGSPPFADDELDRQLFQGRSDEAEQVLHSILSSDLFLLYSVSGLGKSSLLNAGVVQSLRESDHWPVILRMNNPGDDPVSDIAEQIQLAADKNEAVDVLPAPDADPSTATNSLWDLLASIEVWRNNELQRPVLILDQFEELFTLGWDPEVRQRFIQDLGEVVRGHRRPGRAVKGAAVPAPDVKFVLVIREDALGELEALADEIPQVMRNRFRLDPLTDDQAESAVRAPGEIDDSRLDTPRFTYTDAALQTLLGFLGRSAEEDNGHTIGNTRAGIDPSQLQIICQFIERETVVSKSEELAAGEVVVIDDGDLGGTEGLEKILRTFYQRSVEQLPQSDRSAVRTLCETGLINEDERRLSLEEGDIESRYGVSRDTLDELVDERLLRVEPRVGSLYYEVAHDTLIRPILKDLKERRAAKRHRRNVVLGNLSAAALLLGIVAAFWFLGSDSQPDTTDLPIGESTQGLVGAGGEPAFYSVEADSSDAVVVTVSPADELNPAVEVSTPDGTTRIQDSSAAGEPENIVIPPVYGGDAERTIRVTSFDSSTGDFEITAVPTQVTVLGEGVATEELTAESPVAVFAVDSSDEDRTVTVSPGAQESVAAESDALSEGDPSDESQTAADTPKLLDLRIEVIDPTSNVTSVDEGSVGREESVLISGGGVSHVVVRSAMGLAGEFRIEEFVAEVGTAVSSARLELSSPELGSVASDFERTYTISALPAEYLALVVYPADGLDAVVELTRPTGETDRIDDLFTGAPEYVLLEPGEGEYQVRVDGAEFTEGAFEIEVEPVDPVPISASGSVAAGGLVAENRGPITYEVQIPPQSDWILTAYSGPRSDVVIQSNEFGPVVSFAGYLGMPAWVPVSSESDTPRLAGVASSDGISTRICLVPAPIAPIAAGESSAAAGARVFAVDVPEGPPVEFTVDPASESALVVDILDPEEEFTQSAESIGGEPVTTTVGSSGPGEYLVYVVPQECQGGFDVSVEPG